MKFLQVFGIYVINILRGSKPELNTFVTTLATNGAHVDVKTGTKWKDLETKLARRVGRVAESETPSQRTRYTPHMRVVRRSEGNSVS